MKATIVSFLSGCIFTATAVAICAVAFAAPPAGPTPIVTPTAPIKTGTSTPPPPPPAPTSNAPMSAERVIGTPRIVTRTFRAEKEACLRSLVQGSIGWSCSVTYPMPGGSAFMFTDAYTTKDRTIPAWDRDNATPAASTPMFFMEALPNGVTIQLRHPTTSNGGALIISAADARKRFEYQFDRGQMGNGEYRITVMVAP